MGEIGGSMLCVESHGDIISGKAKCLLLCNDNGGALIGGASVETDVLLRGSRTESSMKDVTNDGLLCLGLFFASNGDFGIDETLVVEDTTPLSNSGPVESIYLLPCNETVSNCLGDNCKYEVLSSVASCSIFFHCLIRCSIICELRFPLR